MYGAYYKQRQFYGSKREEACIITSDDGLVNDFALDYEEVIPETVGQFTGLYDKNGKRIFEGDIVKFFDMIGVVLFEEGCFGIVVNDIIDYDWLEEQILPVTGCDNLPYFLYNDNFISFWELLWNYTAVDEQCDVCEVIGNIHDNPELL